jgi:hypothetical protein
MIPEFMPGLLPGAMTGTIILRTCSDSLWGVQKVDELAVPGDGNVVVSKIATVDARVGFVVVTQNRTFEPRV